MPFLAAVPWLTTAIGLGGTAASAIAGRKGPKQTETSQSGPVLNPEQQALQSSLIGKASRDLDAPTFSGGFQASRNQAVTNLNQATDLSRKRLETNLAGRGFGRSGLIAAGANELEVGRVNAIGNIEAQIIQYMEEQAREEEQRRFENARSLLPNYFPEQGTRTSQTRQGFDPFQFLAPFLQTDAFNLGGRGGGGMADPSGWGSG